MTRYKCIVCGKLTAGRIPVSLTNHREKGDLTFIYPRRHKGKDNELCPGSLQEAEWVEEAI